MDVCCAAGVPVTSDYTPSGHFEEVADTKVYVTGQGDKGIVAVYDIFGFDYPQFQQVCDRLADAGFVVAAPDVFRGKPWSLDKFPPKPEDNLMGWIGQFPWEGVVSKDVHTAVELLKSKGVTKFGSAGWCWGAAMAVQAASESPFAATAFFHPSLFGKEKEFCEALNVPLMSVSAQGDPLETIKEVMDTKQQELAAKCVYKRFDNMHHGFCGARGKLC